MGFLNYGLEWSRRNANHGPPRPPKNAGQEYMISHSIVRINRGIKYEGMLAGLGIWNFSPFSFHFLREKRSKITKFDKEQEKALAFWEEKQRFEIRT